MKNNQEAYLIEKFGRRVNFDKMERRLYGHDIGAIPSLIKPLLGATLPDAIVQPQSAEELIHLVQWADKNNVALTSLAKA